MMLTLSFATVNFILFCFVLASCNEVSLPSAPAHFGAMQPGSPPQSDHLAAVDHDGRTRHEAPGIGGKQQKHAVEVALLAEPPRRDFSRDFRALGQEVLAVDLGDYVAGRDGVDPHAPKGEVERERFRE